MVIPPAKTGRDPKSNTPVTSADHGYNTIRFKVIPGPRKFKIVEIKLIAPINEETPAKCSLKIPESTEGPL